VPEAPLLSDFEGNMLRGEHENEVMRRHFYAYLKGKGAFINKSGFDKTKSRITAGMENIEVNGRIKPRYMVNLL
jgi:hypothetical protein